MVIGLSPSPHLRMPGVRVTVTEDCISCGKCMEDVCFVQAIHLEEKHAVIGDDCRGCGRCTEVCPNRAIRLVIDDPDAAAAAIDRLSRGVDVG